MSKHTQGPWAIETLENLITIGAPGAGNVAKVYQPLQGDKQANAALISAAPTMASRIQGAIDALSQNAVFPADIALAKALLIDALETAGIKPLTLKDER